MNFLSLIRDAASPMCFTNGKGATKESALCSALGEFIERLSCDFFYNVQFFGEQIAGSAFVDYPNEEWFQPGPDGALPFVRHSDGEVIYFPSNLIENLYLSNGMSAGNTCTRRRRSACRRSSSGR